MQEESWLKVSVLEEVLLEEYNRSKRIERAIMDEQKQLPKGSIQIKHIADHDYHYLMYREGNKVVSRYLKPDEISIIAAGIQKRKKNKETLKELGRSIKQIQKTLGKDYMSEQERIESRKQINYYVVCINEFARRYSATPREAFLYLDKYKGIDFLQENYDIEHTLSLEDAIDDLEIVCSNNGGSKV